MSDRAILVVAASVLVVGVTAAFLIPPGMCPQGRELVEDLVEQGTYRCRVLYDVFMPARSLIVLRYAMGIGSVLAAAALVLGVLIRHRRGSMPSS